MAYSAGDVPTAPQTQMPRAITLFASQKGGTGKTFISVQVACSYADAHPEENVLFMDLTELGDGTKRLFGGQEFMEGKENKLGGLFGMTTNAKEAEEDEEKRQADAAAGRGRGLLSRLFFRGPEKIEFAIQDHAEHVNSINKTSGLPDNLFLISSGGATIESGEVDEAAGIGSHEDRDRICYRLRQALGDSDKSWRVFIDTDGDRRPNSLTRLGYLLADFCVVPIQADVCDFQRVEQMLSVLGTLREKGEANCKVQLLLWNKVQAYKSEASAVGHFTPPKVSIDTVQHLNGKVSELRKNFGGLFASSFDTVLVRDFPDTVAMSANACGLAFCRMGPGKVTTRGGVTFAVTKDQLQTCQDGIDKIMEKLLDEPDPEA